MKRTGSGVVKIFVYVDEFLIVGSTVAEVKSLKPQVGEQIVMEAWSQESVRVGLEIARDNIN